MSTDVPVPVLLRNSIFYGPLHNFMLFFHSFPADFVEYLIFFFQFILNAWQKCPLVSFFCNLFLQVYQKYLFAFLNHFFLFCKLSFFSTLHSFFCKTRSIPSYWEQELQTQRQTCSKEFTGEIHQDAFAAFNQLQLVRQVWL